MKKEKTDRQNKGFYATTAHYINAVKQDDPYLILHGEK
jgi:hypothetical protein